MISFYYRISLFVFSLAASGGLLFLLKIYYFPEIPFSAENIRHAHSHLMFFGWGIIAPVTVILKKISHADLSENKNIHKNILKSRSFRILMLLIFISSLLSFPAFLVSGYKPVYIGGLKFPFSIAVSTLNMILWYYLIYKLYFISPAPLSFLALSTSGAWGLALLQFFKADLLDLREILKHAFLTWFLFGWMIPVLLESSANKEKTCLKRSYKINKYLYFSVWISIIFLPFSFAAISGDYNIFFMIITGKIAAAIYGIYLMIYACKIIKSKNTEKRIIFNTAAVIFFIAGIFLLFFWYADSAVKQVYRLLFLHLLLAGGASLLIVALLHQNRMTGFIFSVSLLTVVISRIFLQPEIFSSLSVIFAVCSAVAAIIFSVLGALTEVFDRYN